MISDYYVVFRLGGSIYGIGKTPKEAINDANEWVDEELRPIQNLKNADSINANVGDWCIAPCDKDMYNLINHNGGTVKYSISGGIMVRGDRND